MRSKKTHSKVFKVNEFIVYPAYGVGQIAAIEEMEVAGTKLEMFVINFVQDKITLRLPTNKIKAVGLRKLVEPPILRRALDTLTKRSSALSRRPIEKYEAKINSGNIVLIAEVVRDLYDSDTQPERSIYEAALDRLSHEMAAAQRITVSEAIRDIGIMIRGKLTAHETAPTGLRATASGSKLTEPKRLATEGYIDRIWSEVFPIAPALRANPEALAALAHRGYSDDEISLLVLPKNILARRISTGELLTVEETDKALRLERVARLAERIFGSPDKAYRWLRKPKRELHGETPLAFLASEVGARLVEEMLGRIEHGIFA